MRDKKGLLGLSLGSLVELLIVIAFFLLLIFVLWGLISGVWSKDTEEESAISNFDFLQKAVDDVLSDTSEFASTEEFYFLPREYFLIGFNKGESSITFHWPQTQFGIAPPAGTEDPYQEEVFKPDQCGSDACLCLYNELSSVKEGDKNENVVACDVRGEDITFLGYLGNFDHIPRGTVRQEVSLSGDDIFEYENLFLSSYAEGQDSEGTIFIPQSDHYIAKVEKEDATYVLISPYVDSLNRLDRVMKTCPDFSEDPCAGKSRRYAFYNETTDKHYGCFFNGYMCETEELTGECSYGQVTDVACACVDEIASPGDFCAYKAVYDANCDTRAIDQCSDYCLNNANCLEYEQTLCQADPCGAASGGEMECGLDQGDFGISCVTS